MHRYEAADLIPENMDELHQSRSHIMAENPIMEEQSFNATTTTQPSMHSRIVTQTSSSSQRNHPAILSEVLTEVVLDDEESKNPRESTIFDRSMISLYSVNPPGDRDIPESSQNPSLSTLLINQPPFPLFPQVHPTSEVSNYPLMQNRQESSDHTLLPTRVTSDVPVTIPTSSLSSQTSQPPSSILQGSFTTLLNRMPSLTSEPPPITATVSNISGLTNPIPWVPDMVSVIPSSPSHLLEHSTSVFPSFPTERTDETIKWMVEMLSLQPVETVQDTNDNRNPNDTSEQLETDTNLFPFMNVVSRVSKRDIGPTSDPSLDTSQQPLDKPDPESGFAMSETALMPVSAHIPEPSHLSVSESTLVVINQLTQELESELLPKSITETASNDVSPPINEPGLDSVHEPLLNSSSKLESDPDQDGKKDSISPVQPAGTCEDRQERSGSADSEDKREQVQQIKEPFPSETVSHFEAISTTRMCECCGKREARMKVMPCENELCLLCVATGPRCPACGAIIEIVTSL